jgi:adenylate kinase family enzyme
MEVGTPVLVISIRCPKEIAKQRYLNRRLPDRLGDDAEMFEKRFDEFDVNNPAIVDHYRAAGTLEEV